MKNQSIALPARLVLISAFVAAWQAHAQVQETRRLEDFTSVDVGGGVDLLLVTGDRFLVKVQAQEGELANVLTEVRGSTLEIRRDRAGLFDLGNNGSVEVSMPSLLTLTAGGGSEVRSESVFSGDTLEIVAGDGSDVALEVTVEELEVDASGRSKVRLSGTAESLRLRSSNHSEVDAGDLEVEEADVDSSDGSQVRLDVKERLTANASGGSEITYRGDPRDVKADSSGGSTVRPR